MRIRKYLEVFHCIKLYIVLYYVLFKSYNWRYIGLIDKINMRVGIYVLCVFYYWLFTNVLKVNKSVCALKIIVKILLTSFKLFIYLLFLQASWKRKITSENRTVDGFDEETTTTILRTSNQDGCQTDF